MTTQDLVQKVDPDSGIHRLTSVAVVIGALAAIVAGATIWLLLTDPITVAGALHDGTVRPLVRELARAVVEAIRGLLSFL